MFVLFPAQDTDRMSVKLEKQSHVLRDLRKEFSDFREALVDQRDDIEALKGVDDSLGNSCTFALKRCHFILIFFLFMFFNLIRW